MATKSVQKGVITDLDHCAIGPQRNIILHSLGKCNAYFTVTLYPSDHVVTGLITAIKIFSLCMYLSWNET